MLQQPQSGYDVKKTFDQVFSNFWAAHLSQIYPQLKRLTDQGLLDVQAAESDKGPNKKVYQTTAKGQRELVEWLAHGPVTNTEKLAYLAQTFFLGALDSHAQRIGFMEQLLVHMQTWHQALCHIQDEVKAEYPNYPHGLPDEEFYPNLTLMLGVKKVGAKVEWVQESLALLKARE